MIYIAVGYFIYDLVAMAIYGLVDFAMFFHHMTCIVGMTYPLTYGMSANYVVRGMFVAECSNPCMHIRVILKHYGLRYTRAYEMMEISFIILYLFGRMLVGAALVWQNCICRHNALII